MHFQKKKGNPSLKEADKVSKSKILAAAKESNLIKKVEELFPDSELIDIELDKNN